MIEQIKRRDETMIIHLGFVYNLSICISRPPALCLAPSPDPGLQRRLLALAPNLYLLVLAPNLYLPALAHNVC